MNMLYSITYPIFSISYVLISIYYINFINLNSKSIVIFTIIDYITLFLLKYHNLNAEYTSLTLLLIIIFLFYNSKKMIYSFIIAFICMIVIGVSDSIMYIVLIEILGIDSNTLTNTNITYYLAQLILLILVNIISKITSRIIDKSHFKMLFLNNITKDTFIRIQKEFYIELSLIIISIIIFILTFTHQLYNKTLSPTVFISISLILLSFIFLSFFFISTREYKSQIEKQYKYKEFNELYEHTKSLEKMSLALKKYENNFLDILDKIEKYIDENDLINLKKFYYTTVLENKNEILSKDYSLEPLNYIDESTLRSIILSKFISAKVNGLKIKITIIEKILPLSIIINDICTIISKLLDISINEAIITNEKFIHFSIINTDTTVVFIIQNSYCDSASFAINNKENMIVYNTNISKVLEILSYTNNHATLNTTYFKGTVSRELTIQK